MANQNHISASTPKTQLETDLSINIASLFTAASTLALDLSDPASLKSILDILVAALPAPTSTEATSNQALAAQRRRLVAHQEAEKVYARDMINASGEKTGFFAFPGEVRNQIYHLCLVFPGRGCRFESIASQKRIKNKTKLISILSDFRPNVSLLRTSSEVRDEAIKILYGGNTFSSHRQTRAAWNALVQTVRPHSSLIRQVQLVFDGHLRVALHALHRVAIFSKVVVYFPSYHASWSGYSRKFAQSLGPFITEQLALRMAIPEAEAGHGNDVEDSVKRAEAIKLLEVFELGCPDAVPKYLQFGDTEQVTDSIYDLIAIQLGLIGEGETLQQQAKVSKDIRDWKEGKAEQARKKLVRRSFGLE